MNGEFFPHVCFVIFTSFDLKCKCCEMDTKENWPLQKRYLYVCYVVINLCFLKAVNITALCCLKITKSRSSYTKRIWFKFIDRCLMIVSHWNVRNFFRKLISVLNIWSNFIVMSRFMQNWTQPPACSVHGLHRMLPYYWLAHFHLMKKSAKV